MEVKELIEKLKEMPQDTEIDVAEVHHGAWILDEEKCYKCSNCNARTRWSQDGFFQIKTPYCSFCGSKMDR